MNKKDIIGRIYRHFKGNFYQIEGIAKHSETGEELVVYKALYGDYELYVRPYDMFFSKVDKNKYPDVSQEFRFEQVDLSDLANAKVKQDDEIKAVVKENNEPVKQVVVAKEETDLTEGVNRDLLIFLEADTYEEKRTILKSIRPRLDDKLINSIASSLDLVVDEGDIEVRYNSILNCLDTMARFEVTRP